MKLLIYDAVKRYADKTPTRFHMPSHKGTFNLFADAFLDVTELDFIDNERVRLTAERECAEILGVEYLRFSSDGATSLILSAVYAVKDFGKKLIVSRNSHKSVFNALNICGLEPVVVDGVLENGIVLPPSVNQILTALNANDGVIGALITSPDYYGNSADIKAIADLLHANGKLLVCDNSHGGHYAFVDGLDYAPHYADIAVDSAHKVLYTLNQGAYITCNAPALVDSVVKATDIFLTTSPSYLILASVEYGVKYLAENILRLKELADAVNSLKEKILKLGFGVVNNLDPFKLSVDFSGKRVGAGFAQKFLEDQNIFAEMNDGRYILFMFSIATVQSQLDGLYASLTRLKEYADNACDKQTADRVSQKEKLLYALQNTPPVKSKSYLDAISLPSERVDLDDACGRVIAENAGFTPPCVPVIIAGEIINKEIALALKSGSVFGVHDGKVKVLKR